MDGRRRFAVRPGAVRLTALQWLLAGAALVLGAGAAVVLLVAVSMAAAGIALGLTAVAAALVLGFGWPQRPGGRLRP